MVSNRRRGRRAHRGRDQRSFDEGAGRDDDKRTMIIAPWDLPPQQKFGPAISETARPAGARPSAIQLRIHLVGVRRGLVRRKKRHEKRIHRPEACRSFSASSLGCRLRKLPSANYRIPAIRSRIPDADPVHACAIGHVQPDDSIQARTQHVQGQGALQLCR